MQEAIYLQPRGPTTLVLKICISKSYPYAKENLYAIKLLQFNALKID